MFRLEGIWGDNRAHLQVSAHYWAFLSTPTMVSYCAVAASGGQENGKEEVYDISLHGGRLVRHGKRAWEAESGSLIHCFGSP